MLGRFLWCAAIAVLGLLLFASGAGADTYCVLPATGCTHSDSTISEALSAAAAATGGPNTIRLGAATYAGDELKYEGLEELTIEGAGPDATTIERSSPANGVPVLELFSGGIKPVNVSGLRIHEAGGTGLYGLLADGIGGGTLSDIKIDGAAGSTSSEGLGASGGGWTLVDSMIEAGAGDCIYTSAVGMQMSDDTLRECPYGINARGEGLTAQRLQIRGAHTGLLVGEGQVRLEDSLIEGAQRGLELAATGETSLLAKQDTILGTGGGVGAECFNYATTEPADLTLEDSILRDFPTSLKSNTSSGKTCPLTAKYNDFEGEVEVEGGGIVSNSNQYPEDPLFIDEGAGNYRLSAGSPVLNLDTRPLESPESATDLDGGLRIIGGARDLGAYERPLPASAANGGVDSVTTSGARVLGTLDTGGALGSWSLRYGTSGAYGTETPASAVAAATGGQPVSAALSGLSEGQTYHYQFVLSTPYGTFTSPDATFATRSQSSGSSSGGSSGGGGGSAAPVPTARRPYVTASRVARVKHGKALLRLRCHGVGRCRGVVKLTARIKSRRRSAHRRVRRVEIGRARFSVPRLSAKTVKVSLTARGRKLVGTAGKRGLKVRLGGRSVKGRIVVLKPAR